MISVLFLQAVANDASFHFFFFDYRQRSAKVLKNQGFFITVKAIIMWNVSHKIIGARRLAY